MNSSFMKLFSKRPASASRVPHAVSARRHAGCGCARVSGRWPPCPRTRRTRRRDHRDDTSVTLPDPLGPPSAEDQKSLPDVAMTSQIVFQVLAAEVALQRDQPAPAYQTYLALARDTHDPRMAQRATEIALAAQSPYDALTAAQLWQQLRRSSERAAQLDASLLCVRQAGRRRADCSRRELAKVPRGESRQSDPRAADCCSRADRIASAGCMCCKDLLKNDMNRPEAQLAIARQQLARRRRAGRTASRSNRRLQLKPDYLPAALTLVANGPGRTQGRHRVAREIRASKNPKSHDARLALAQMYLSSDSLDDAQKQFEIMRKNDPKDLTPLMALALIKIQQKKFDKAQDLSERSTRRRPKARRARIAGQAYIYLAQLSLEQKDEAAASQWLDKIPRTSQQYLPAQITRAQLLAKQGKVDDARTLLGNLQPAPIRAIRRCSRAPTRPSCSTRKRYTEAETRLAAGHGAAFPDDPDLAYDYAMAAEKNGHYDVMEAQLRKLMQTQPDNPQAYNALGYSLADRNQRLAEADKLVEKASSLAPNDAFIMDSVGWVKYRMGNTSDATRCCAERYDMQPNAEIGAHLGEV